MSKKVDPKPRSMTRALALGVISELKQTSDMVRDEDIYQVLEGHGARASRCASSTRD